MLKALLIRNHFDGLSTVSDFLCKRGCEVRYATSYEEARALISDEGFDFDLVLTPMRLGRRSGLDLVPFLQGSRITLFFSVAVENGAWWMPALRAGMEVFGTAALRSTEFNAALDDALQEAVFHRQLRRASAPEMLRKAAG